MDCYFDLCDKTIISFSKNKLIQSPANNEFENCIRLKHIVQNHDFVNMDEIIHEHINHHIKKKKCFLLLLISK